MKKHLAYLAPLPGLIAISLGTSALAQSVQFPTYQVGPQSNGTYVMSTGQIVSAAGNTLILGSPVRSKAVVLNPTNSNTAAVLNMGAAQAVQVLDLNREVVLQNYSPFGDNSGSFTGIAYTPDGKHLLFSQDDSYVAIASVDPTSGLLSDYEQLPVAPSQAYINCSGITVGLPSDPLNFACGQFYNGNSYTSNPAGLAVTPDSKTAYAILNGNNTVQPIDLTVDPPQLKGNQFRVGNAPNSIVIAGTYAFVSNEGGRPAHSGDFTNVSNGTPIVADPFNAHATTGTVTIVDLTSNSVFATLKVGTHPTGMAVANGFLYVCNTYDETISVIDLSTFVTVNTIKLNIPINGMKKAFGAEPTGIAVVGTVAYVTLYTSNAIAVVDLSGGSQQPVLGYIPTDSTPATIAYDATRNQLVVSNDKGVGTWGSLARTYGVTGYNSHQDTGTVNFIPVPNAQQLSAYTTQVYQNNHWDLTANINASRGGKSTRPPVAIPAHIGDPSLIQHVFVIVRENRTYDQILGDVPQGNGDASLAVFGGQATPNAHNLIQRFPLLDNYYNPSRQSADGHNWLVQSIAPYMDDIQSPDWVRSYPANGLDALAYQPKGFVWDAAEKKGLKVKLYGEYVEYTGYHFTPPGGGTAEPSWSQWFQDALNFESGAETSLFYATTPNATSEIPSVQNVSVPHFPLFDLNIPDQWRVDQWNTDFQNDLKGGTVPSLEFLWIMDDHTGGPPTALAEQADNDLAVGRIVDIISHSNVWNNSAIFITEDDAQNGVDHVDGHRSPGYVVSPYAVQYQPANHTYFAQMNVTRTIEQILGLAPMNFFDLTASPMFNLFTNSGNFAPWTHVQNIIPLDQGVGGNYVKSLSPVGQAWEKAKADIFQGKLHQADAEDADVVNHLDWYEATGFTRPYPGEKTVKSPADFADKIAHPSHDLDQ